LVDNIAQENFSFLSPLVQKKTTFKELDLRWGKTNYSVYLSDEEIESISIKFNSIINFYHKVLNDKLDWWFSPVSARNNFGSPLFHHFLCFQICLKLVEEKTIPSKCITDSDAVYNGLLKLKNSEQWDGYIIHSRQRSRVQMLIKMIKSFSRVICHTIYPYLLIKFTFKKTKYSSNIKSLIDTFVLPGNEYSDRYYSGISDFLSKKEISKIRFVPTFSGYRLRDYFFSIRKLRYRSDKFLFKEDFLTFSDIFYSLLHALRLLNLSIPSVKIVNFDLSAQLKEELRRFGGLEDGVHGFINYNFAKRLRSKGVKIKTVVDWFENHGRDRGWNYGFHRFHQNINTLGYNMVFLSKWHLAFSPLPLERENEVLPKKILTPCRKLIEFIKKNDPMINVKTTGSFRFPIPKTRFPSKELLSILVPLSFKSDAATNSVKNVRNMFREISKCSNLDFLIRFKPHPAILMSQVAELKNYAFNTNEIWTTKPLCDELQTANIVLGEWTFSLLEALNAGIPVGVIRSTDGLFHSSIPYGAAESLTFDIDSLNSLKKLIKIAQTIESSELHSKGILLEPPSRFLAQEALGLL